MSEECFKNQESILIVSKSHILPPPMNHHNEDFAVFDFNCPSLLKSPSLLRILGLQQILAFYPDTIFASLNVMTAKLDTWSTVIS